MPQGYQEHDTSSSAWLVLGVQVSLSFTLGRNEKVEQYIRKKIRKPNALRFWVEGGVISLYVGLGSHCLRSPQGFPPRILPTVSQLRT